MREWGAQFLFTSGWSHACVHWGFADSLSVRLKGFGPFVWRAGTSLCGPVLWPASRLSACTHKCNTHISARLLGSYENFTTINVIMHTHWDNYLSNDTKRFLSVFMINGMLITRSEFQWVILYIWTVVNMDTRSLAYAFLAGAHTCLQFMRAWLKIGLIKTKYVRLTVLPLHPGTTEQSQGATYHAGKLEGGTRRGWRSGRGRSDNGPRRPADK